MIQFRRRQVGQQLIDELLYRVRSGQSSVILGARYGGKKHILRALGRALNEDIGLVLVERSSVHDPAVANVVMIGGTRESSVAPLVPLLDKLFDIHKKPILLLLAGIDSLPHHEARKLLSDIRTRVEERRLVVVVAGETNLSELVHGPKSEFNCAVQYVLQGYDLPEFEKYLQEYNSSLLIKWTSPEFAAIALHKMTAGNTYLLRMMVSLVLDWRAEKKIGPDSLVDPEDLLSHHFRLRALPEAYWAHVFRHTAQVIASEPDCWNDLRKLLDEPEIQVGMVNQPQALELSGLAALHGATLRIESLLMREFAREYYSKRKFGDLYAQNGEWAKAFLCYESLPENERIRPSGQDDLYDIELLVRSLGSAMHEAANAADGERRVEELFSCGCRLVLGFPTVLFWKRLNQNPWLIEDPETLLGPKIQAQCEQLLEATGGKLGWLSVDEDTSLTRVASAVVLKTGHSATIRCVIVGDLDKRIVISLQRKRLAGRMAQEFFDAHSHAVEADMNRRRLITRDAHVRIITRIFSGLGSRLLDQKQVLKLSANELRKLGYKRVMFSLVDPERTIIKGAWDEPGTPVNLADLTEYPLDRPEADLQPWIVSIGKSMIIPDANKEPLCSRKAVVGANLMAMAVVPILDHHGVVFGTIHIEREDGAVPSKEEVEDLELFGKMLAGLLAQTRRMTMIYEALNKVPEPLLISDRKGLIKFANQPACELFREINSGWQETPVALSGSGSEKVRDWIEKANRHRRHVEQVKGVGKDGQYQGEVLCAQIELIGFVVHIDDQNFLNRIFEAIPLVGQSTSRDDLVSRLLEATKLLDFEKSRFYRKDPLGDRLISNRCLGHSIPKQARFESGEIILPKQEETSWRCITTQEPQVFIWDRNAPPHELIRTNKWGLSGTIVRDEDHNDILEKIEGSVRVDIALGFSSNLLGKLSLERKKDLKPEELRLIGVLAKLSIRILDAILQKENIIGLQKLEDGTRRAFAMASHQFRNELTPIDTRLSRYMLCAEASAAVSNVITPLNEALLCDLQLLHEIVDRMPQLLGHIAMKCEEFDLVSLVRGRLERHDMIHKLISEHDTLIVVADRLHIDSVIHELLENTRGMWQKPGKPELEISLSVIPGDRVRVVYQDWGPGIPDSISEGKIFELAYSYRPGQDAGTGIGLDYAKRVLKAHGGDIRTEKCAKGARFVLEFPKSQRSA